MTAPADALHEDRWAPREDIAGLRVGDCAPPLRVAPSPERTGLLRASVENALSGPVTGPATLMDLCPDPLVFAVAAGLPRPVLLDRQIDGGSEWEQHTPLPDGDLTAVSRVAAIEGRVSRDGRRLLRVVYQSDFYVADTGEAIGCCRGSSLHLEARA